MVKRRYDVCDSLLKGPDRLMTGRTIYCGAVLAGIIYDAGDAQGRHPNECIDVRTFGINGLTSE